MALLGSFIPKALLPSATSTRLSYYLRKAMIITYRVDTEDKTTSGSGSHTNSSTSGSTSKTNPSSSGNN
ncbi:hypothetical protein MANES_03G099100v8 [Manihot esculenta]|uniref:Uncharacterized protein n=1 Tax=Manihot esculenta TaxID=3983 RepID=A0A2C9W652_MANES|nr:hypothetical protein MANES_03G099100v8 [Manihot esculenta]